MAIQANAMDHAAVEDIVELTLRLSRVMRPEYVTTWLRTPGAESIGRQRPIDLIARGDIDTVLRIVSGLESPGAI